MIAPMFYVETETNCTPNTSIFAFGQDKLELFRVAHLTLGWSPLKIGCLEFGVRSCVAVETLASFSFPCRSPRRRSKRFLPSSTASNHTGPPRSLFSHRWRRGRRWPLLYNCWCRAILCEVPLFDIADHHGCGERNFLDLLSKVGRGSTTYREDIDLVKEDEIYCQEETGTDLWAHNTECS
jgi:hypothetical protein